MKTKGMATLSVAFALLVALTPGASAAGSEFIEGEASGFVRYYYRDRIISTPGAPGPAVAFRQNSGPVGLQLGVHNCNTVNISTLKDQTPGIWTSVVSTLPAGTVFCMRSFSTSGSGDFDGTLAWD